MAKGKKITYLFGAGASAGNRGLLNSDLDPEGIPIVEDFNKDIKIFIDNLSPNTSDRDPSIIIQMQRSFRSVYENLRHIFSFDTYAKTLKESGRTEDYNQLKILLKCYLIYRQYAIKRDKRYDLFFATLLNDGYLPENVNFVSWNYDTQIELSLSNFNKTKEHPTFTEYINTGLEKQQEQKPFLIKLNGSIGISDDLKSFEHVIAGNPNYTSARHFAIEAYKKYSKSKIDPAFYFSWEKNANELGLIDKAKEILSETSILVIIGYSFPTLNRILDKNLLSKLRDGTKIYIQSPTEEDFIAIREKLSALILYPIKQKISTMDNQGNMGSMEIEHTKFINSIKEFYIPFELH